MLWLYIKLTNNEVKQSRHKFEYRTINLDIRNISFRQGYYYFQNFENRFLLGGGQVWVQEKPQPISTNRGIKNRFGALTIICKSECKIALSLERELGLGNTKVYSFWYPVCGVVSVEWVLR
jgi:hypothetical protein